MCIHFSYSYIVGWHLGVFQLQCLNGAVLSYLAVTQEGGTGDNMNTETVAWRQMDEDFRRSCCSRHFIWIFQQIQPFFPYFVYNNYSIYIYIYMGAGINIKHGSRSRAHTRSILHDPYPDPYPMILHDPYPWSIPLIRTPFSLKKDWCWP